MLPLVVLVFLVGGIAYVASREDDGRDPTSKLPDITDLPEPADVDDDDRIPDGPGWLPQEPVPPEIPYGPRLVFELWLDEEGQIRAADGTEYDELVQIDVCPGDTVVLHTPPQNVDDDAVGFLEPQDAGGAAWVQPVIDSWEHGLFVWHVVDEPGGRRALLGAEVFDYDEQKPFRFGFDVVLLDECEAVV